MNYKARREAVREQLEEHATSLLLVTEPNNRRYLSGFCGSAGWLLICPTQAFLITDGRYWDQVTKQCPDINLFKYRPSEHDNLAGALIALVQEHKLLPDQPELGIELDGLSLSNYRLISETLSENGISGVELKGTVSSLRECKDSHEIELLRKAAHIADRALSAALAEFRPGLRECDLKAELEYNILKFGGTSTSFSTIVASGPNGSYPHAGASERVVGEGELITIDFGAIHQGYCSDMTRTIWYGELAATSANILEQTRKAQQAALDAVRAGIRASQLDAVARDLLTNVQLGDFFVHSLGHGVGLEIHEAPGLRKTNEDELKVGQVVTIEPGVYLPGETGCRVEDTVVVTASGCELLNRFPKQPLDHTSPLTTLP